MKPMTPLESAMSRPAPLMFVPPVVHGGDATVRTSVGGTSLLDEFAMRAVSIPPWPFEIEGVETPPEPLWRTEMDMKRLALACPGKTIEALSNQREIDAVVLRNVIRARAQWPWVYARAVLSMRPPPPSNVQSARNGRP